MELGLWHHGDLVQRNGNHQLDNVVAALMGLRNELQAVHRSGVVDEAAWSEGIDTLLLLLAPIAPFISEEVWRLRGGTGSVHVQAWPEADPDLARDETVTMVVQVNGKVRDRIEVEAEVGEEAAIALALASERVQGFLDGGEPKKIIARPPKLVNIVV